MNTRTARYAAVFVAFVLVGSPGQTFAADGEPSFDELDLRRETTELLKEAQKARLAGQSAEALKLYEQAYLYLPVKLVAAELGLMELQVGEYIDAARHLDESLHSEYGPDSKRSMRMLLQKLEEARTHIATFYVTTNALNPKVSVDGLFEITRGWPWRFYTSPGKHTITLRAEGYWLATKDVELKEGETADVYIGMQDKIRDRIVHYPPANEPANVPAGAPGAERPEWAKTLLITSGVALGVSVAIGITGLTVASYSPDTDQQMKHAGVGMIVGGAIGLGMSLTGLVISLGYTPSTTIHYYSRQEPPANTSTLVLSPRVGPGMVGLGARGAF